MPPASVARASARSRRTPRALNAATAVRARILLSAAGRWPAGLLAAVVGEGMPADITRRKAMVAAAPGACRLTPAAPRARQRVCRAFAARHLTSAGRNLPPAVRRLPPAVRRPPPTVVCRSLPSPAVACRRLPSKQCSQLVNEYLPRAASDALAAVSLGGVQPPVLGYKTSSPERQKRLASVASVGSAQSRHTRQS